MITFDSFDIRPRYNDKGEFTHNRDINQQRSYTLRGFTFNATIHKMQWANPEYGSKENPYPVFARDIIDDKPQLKERFDVSEKLNFLFVKEYLNYLVSRKELKSLNLGEERIDINELK